tara:strand:+ start:439 stop:723 length:285 start_codon:yes stop_codon:yes gene_type:complete
MDITIYTTTGCFYCKKAKELLDRAKIEYNIVSVIPKLDPRAELPEASMWKEDFGVENPGVNAFPFTIVDGKPIAGLIDLAKLLVKEGLVSARKD